ncbi:TIM-barrel domain-containing protein [Weeksellaceae bacterium A-14]
MYKSIFRVMLMTLLFVCTKSAYAQKQGNNVVYQDQNVRFTVITDGAIRMEWGGNFVDNASFLATERTYPAVKYKLKKGSWIEIETSRMKVRYKNNTGKFTADNLIITNAKGVKPFTWKPGIRQKENLGGTLRTLDGMNGDMQMSDVAEAKAGEKRKLDDGLLSKDGWTFLDDSQNFLFDNSSWPWVEPRKDKNGQDWYFMAYGDDYKAALKDFTVFAGKIPLPPRYAFGYWWSRYWSYSDSEFRSLIDNFHNYGIPLDVLVVDMDWHYTDEGRGGWTGWTWNKNLFPNPENFLKYLKKNDLKITLNLHPADGVSNYEQGFEAMAKDMGLDPKTTKNIPWTGSDKNFIKALFKDVLHPMQKEGVDFWWLDWQQFPFDKKVEGLSNTWWINYVFFSDKEHYGDERPMLYHRWGGLGNHRYQVGFSGDTHISWKSLDFQPYFNSTASNVLYGYWSHDLGGHMNGQINPELYLRWMQFGAFSPVMRTHSSKSAELNKEPWVFDKDTFTILKNTIKQRYELAPYIYTAARESFDSGVSLCRPLYYDDPENQQAYSFRNEYMFGDDILVAPVTQKGKDGYTEMQVWLPEGKWYEWNTGTLLKGGQTLKRNFALDEYGIYVKAGAIIPMYNDSVMNLSSNDEDYIINIFPGADGDATVYEDNGNDKNYASEYATTEITAKRKANTLDVYIAARKGQYKDMPQSRNYKIKLLAATPPASITLNGKPVNYEYLGKDFSVLIDLGNQPCNTAKNIQITFGTDAADLTNGIIGKSRRIAKYIEQLKYRDAGIVLSDDLGQMGSVQEAVMYAPEKFSELVQKFNKSYDQLPEILQSQKLDDAKSKWFLQSVGYGKY